MSVHPTAQTSVTVVQLARPFFAPLHWLIRPTSVSRSIGLPKRRQFHLGRTSSSFETDAGILLSPLFFSSFYFANFALSPPPPQPSLKWPRPMRANLGPLLAVRALLHTPTGPTCSTGTALTRALVLRSRPELLCNQKAIVIP